MPASVRVNERTWSILKEIADNVGETMQSVLEKAIESYRRQWILQQTNEAYAALRNDESAWQEELAERRLWDSSLSDGLGGDDH
ncbi:MAG: toxin-antitoxin system protein [Syntrophomonadales bacterium]|jgi:predicted transcriptional regulator